MFSLYFRGLPRREAYSQLSGTHRFEDSEEDFWVNWLSQSLVDVRLANRRCSAWKVAVPSQGCGWSLARPQDGSQKQYLGGVCTNIGIACSMQQITRQWKECIGGRSCRGHHERKD